LLPTIQPYLPNLKAPFRRRSIYIWVCIKPDRIGSLRHRFRRWEPQWRCDKCSSSSSAFAYTYTDTSISSSSSFSSVCAVERYVNEEKRMREGRIPPERTGGGLFALFLFCPSNLRWVSRRGRRRRRRPLLEEEPRAGAWAAAATAEGLLKKLREKGSEVGEEEADGGGSRSLLPLRLLSPSHPI
jgi:hypothetical protein